jgi:hypothetical protein
MNRKPKNVGKSTPASAAQARRLILERLEMRSVLATMFGLPESATLAGGIQASDVDAQNKVQLRPVGAFPFFSPGTSGQFEVVPADIDSLVVNGESVPVAIGDADSTWTVTEPGTTTITNLDAIAFSNITASLQLSKSWFSLNRPGIVRPIEIHESDLPVNVIDVEHDATNDDSSSGDSPKESSQTPNDPPASTTPSQPTNTPKANDVVSASPRLLSLLEIEETHSTAAGTLRSSSPHADETHHALNSQLTSNLDHRTPGQSELAEDPETKKEQAESELASELLELPASRNLQTNAEVWTSEQRTDGPTSAQRSAVAGANGPQLFNPMHATEFGLEVMSSLSIPDDIVPSFDEGGLVELIAAEAIRGNDAAKNVNGFGASRNEGIDAEVGMFQAIDVAASLIEDPSQALMAPFAVVIVFQFFNQRRKDAALDEMMTRGHEPRLN